MKHLTHAELVDAAEAAGQPCEAAARHLRECPACRSEAEAVRAMIVRAVDDQLPEPSPLFWQHFTARVSEAVASESVDADRSWLHPTQRPLAAWAVAAAALVLMITTIVWRATLHAPSPVRPPSIASSPVASGETSGATTLPETAADNPDADDRWAVVRLAAEGLDWDDVQAAGIAAASGAAEGLALELSEDERIELARLLGGVRPGWRQ